MRFCLIKESKERREGGPRNGRKEGERKGERGIEKVTGKTKGRVGEGRERKENWGYVGEHLYLTWTQEGKGYFSCSRFLCIH